jgi:hypothetical protein
MPLSCGPKAPNATTYRCAGREWYKEKKFIKAIVTWVAKHVGDSRTRVFVQLLNLWICTHGNLEVLSWEVQSATSVSGTLGRSYRRHLESSAEHASGPVYTIHTRVHVQPQAPCHCRYGTTAVTVITTVAISANHFYNQHHDHKYSHCHHNRHNKHKHYKPRPQM